MNMMSRVSDIARAPGDPRVLAVGPSVRPAPDRLARGLGWLSIGLGLAEILAARRLAGALGMQGQEGLIRACGAREIASGVLSLSVDPQVGIGSRLAGDGVDLAALAAARNPDNRRRANVDLALAAVAGIAALDLVCLAGLRARHARGRGPVRDYRDRSGLPRGVEASRGLASGATPPDMRAQPRRASAAAPA